jgi:AraC family transcriptional regulator
MAALSSHSPKLLGADRPFFAKKESLDDIRSLSSVSFAHGDLSIGRYRRDRPGLGITPSNPLSATVMAVVLLRPLPALRGWNDGRLLEMPARGAGALSCLDLREVWSMDMSDPFDSLHTYIPLAAFDEITSELKRPRIERLNSLLSADHRDATMLHLVSALNPILARPEQATALFIDHVFLAIVAHLAVTYGGLRGDMPASAGQRDRMLTPLQERRVTNRLLDDLGTDTNLAELAALCGLSRSHFIRAFKHTTGLPPHRWLLMQRVKRAKELLQGTRMPIVEIATACGFADQSHLTRVFSKAFRISPAVWRRQWGD